MKLSHYIEKYMWVLNLILLLILGWAAARVTSTAVRAHFTRLPQIEPWKPPVAEETSQDATYPISVEKIEARNLFRAKIKDEEAAPLPDDNGEITLTPLDLELEGVITGPGWAFATIRDKRAGKKKVQVLAIGEEVKSGVVVAAIEPRRVVFQRANGDREELLLDYKKNKNTKKKKGERNRNERLRPRSRRTTNYGKGIKKISETEYVIERESFQAALENMNELITQARLVPNFGPDRKVDGFRIFRVRPGSLFQNLGLKNGDIIHRVNGVELDDAQKGFEFFQTLSDQSNFTIDLKRGNDRKTFKYDVK